MVLAALGFELWTSDNHWECDCGNLVVRGDRYAVRLRNNSEICMECYEEEKAKG